MYIGSLYWIIAVPPNRRGEYFSLGKKLDTAWGLYNDNEIVNFNLQLLKIKNKVIDFFLKIDGRDVRLLKMYKGARIKKD